jgi:hypothetical protein
VTPALITGVLSAGMEYSVFLELARGGKWAFLMPVLVRHEADIIAILQQQLGPNALAFTPSTTPAPDLAEQYERTRTAGETRVNRSEGRAAREA